uniref:Uncharacterized protein n=1 Tax=Haematococcus lacustris TaxID=44745 RepID=A0A2K9YRK6_HAELA|nr:hypothetical protein SG3EUKT975009.1 [Haematococcus lacustris]AUW36462.1 hypothetical protein SG3EUKT975009.1 [Haematococcus lacustris]
MLRPFDGPSLKQPGLDGRSGAPSPKAGGPPSAAIEGPSKGWPPPEPEGTKW